MPSGSDIQTHATAQEARNTLPVTRALTRNWSDRAEQWGRVNFSVINATGDTSILLEKQLGDYYDVQKPIPDSAETIFRR